jgi:Leucine-rich repeat (LRR) protein
MRERATTFARLGCQIVLGGCLVLGLASEAHATIPASERAALIALYNSTNGAGWWYFRYTWRNPTDTDFAPPGTECTWVGVECDPAGSHVTRLDLSGALLSGPPPLEIGDLTALSFLSFAYNRLTGSIPPQIGNLAQLADLELFENQLSGSIPPEIGDLSSLEVLLLGSNQLTGSIPPEIGRLTNLVSLEAMENQLTGPIPPEIGNLSQLSSLWLLDNQLSGPIPREIGNLTSLDRLYLGGNQLSGSIPPEIGALTKLEALYLADNQLTGPIPPEIGRMTALGYLVLSRNQLTGSIPAEIGALAHLSTLAAAENQLSGSIPAEIGNLPNLGTLYLDDNQLCGSIPPQIGGHPKLWQVSLAGNQLTGSIPPGIFDLPYLQYLDLSRNQLSGPIPPEIGRLSMRSYSMWGIVRLDHNRLTGSIPRETGDAKNLLELGLDGNQLTGSIPPEIGKLATLTTLNLSDNQLTGPIPLEIGNLTNLETLDLSGNQLTGSIPAQIGRLAMGFSWAPGAVHLDHNQLSGPIPSAIGNMSYLGALSLADNRLSGPIPDQLGSLRYLSAMLLQSNRLAGPIPATLANLTGLADGTSDLRWNALHTDDPALRDFLNSKQAGGDWESTQTVAPAGLAAGSPTLDAVPLSWSPILYTGDTGSYRIWYGTQAGGPYSFGGATADKAASAAVVGGLSPGTTYFFSLETVTEPHANNRNTVVSERVEVSAATALGGEGWPVLAVVTHGLGTVSSSPGSISCGLACSATFAPGTPVTLAAAPEPGSGFLGWGGACAGTALMCDLTMDSAQTVTATFSTPAVSFYTVTPCRVFDSRDAGLGGPAALAAGSDNAISVAGHCTVPPTAKAVSLNVTVVSPSAGGHLRLFALGTQRPNVSSINYAEGQTRANNAVVSLGADGAVIAYVNQPSGAAHVVLDVNGYFQ